MPCLAPSGGIGLDSREGSGVHRARTKPPPMMAVIGPVASRATGITSPTWHCPTLGCCNSAESGVPAGSKGTTSWYMPPRTGASGLLGACVGQNEGSVDTVKCHFGGAEPSREGPASSGELGFFFLGQATSPPPKASSTVYEHSRSCGPFLWEFAAHFGTFGEFLSCSQRQVLFGGSM